MKDIKKEELENISGGEHWHSSSTFRDLRGKFYLDKYAQQFLSRKGYTIESANIPINENRLYYRNPEDDSFDFFHITDTNGNPISTETLENFFGPDDNKL